MKNSETATIPQIAKMLGISRVAALQRIKPLIQDGKVKAVEQGKGYVVDLSSLPEAMKHQIQERRAEAAQKMESLEAKTGTDIAFIEKELWAAADELRGNLDASEYKHVVLGLLFLKYVSDAFYRRREDLERRVKDPKDKEYYIPDESSRHFIVDDKDQYKGRGGFYIPPKARWDYLRDKAMRPDIGKYIDEAMEEIEQENNKELKGVLPRDYSRATLDSSVLGALVNVFSRIQFNEDIHRERDILGRVYEYFLAQFAAAEGRRGGEFFTPRSVVQLLVEILEPYENVRIFDPAVGSGGMFVQSSEFLKMHNQDPTRLAFFGQEYNPTTMKLCKMNLAIRGINNQVELGNSYYDDKFPDLRADFVLANPPFNAKWDPNRLSEGDPRLRYGTPPSGSANFMWIQHFIHHLAPNGMAGFVMANGALAVGGREGDIRKKIIEDDLVDVIVACPAKLFYSVSLPVSLWFLSKNKKGGRFKDRTGKVLFIDARETFEQISRRQVNFSDEHVDKIAGTVRAWRGQKGAGKYEDVAGFCKEATLEEIAKAGYVLTPGRYVGMPDEEDDGVPFEEKMAKLSAELVEAFKKGDELEKQIRGNIKKLGI